jgi:hypothetical protein
VQRLLGVHEASLARLDLDRDHVAHIALRQELLERRIDLERVRRGHELLDELGHAPRGLEHAARLRDVHGHARLAEDVLAPGEHSARDLGVGVGPGADAHRVDVGRAHELAPVAVDASDPEFLRDLLARRLRTVGDGDQLDSRLGREFRDVVLPRIGAGADESYADRFVCHGAGW